MVRRIEKQHIQCHMHIHEHLEFETPEETKKTKVKKAQMIWLGGEKTNGK